MEVDEKLIKHIATLARLDLTKREVDTFTPQIKEVLDHFQILDECDTNDVKPSFHPVPLKNALREDKKEDCLEQDKALQNAKDKKDGYFKGPQAV